MVIKCQHRKTFIQIYCNNSDQRNSNLIHTMFVASNFKTKRLKVSVFLGDLMFFFSFKMESDEDTFVVIIQELDI